MGFHRPLRHVELFRDLRIVATLEQQVGYLPLPRAQANQLFLHTYCPFLTKTNEAAPPTE